MYAGPGFNIRPDREAKHREKLPSITPSSGASEKRQQIFRFSRAKQRSRLSENKPIRIETPRSKSSTHNSGAHYSTQRLQAPWIGFPTLEV